LSGSSGNFWLGTGKQSEDNWLGKLKEKLPDCRVAIQIPFRKNSSDRLGTVFVIPPNKCFSEKPISRF
jgi:hypothetical protein